MNKNHKFESNKKYFTISIYSIAVILIACIIFRLVTQWAMTQKMIIHLWDTLFPFFMGFLIAYIMNPVVNFFHRNVFHKIWSGTKPKAERLCSIVTSYLIFIGAFAICLFFIVPQLFESIQDLSLQIPQIYNTIVDFFQNYIKTGSHHLPPELLQQIETKTLPALLEYSNDAIENIIPWLYNFSISFAKGLFNLFIAFVVSIYMTTDKNILKKSCKKLILAIFNEKRSYAALRLARDCHNIFSGFIVGKSIDSLIIGIICFVLMNILSIPYALLISVVVGITNMIPYFGPFFGAIPSAFILFIIDPMKALIFIIMVLVLQQFDGLVLGPKILGNSTGVRPLLILFSIMVGGEYFGPLGMFLGVPFFATVQYLVDNWVSYRLYKKNISKNIEEED